MFKLTNLGKHFGRGLILSNFELSVRTKLNSQNAFRNNGKRSCVTRSILFTDSGCAIKLQPSDFSNQLNFSENIGK
ncbi:Uncharacterised protein [uncultured archaeon]|nr:Uncharacterised protein [uncultured archaeon]